MARSWATPPVIVLVVVLLGGVGLRLGFMLVWRPAFLGFPDSGLYLQEARDHTWAVDPIRTGGYPIFIGILHDVSRHLTFVTLVQHLLGLATGLLLYGAARRVGATRWLPLVPAAVVLLGGSEIFLEHAVLTEAPFMFLVAAALYTAVRSRGSSDPRWPYLTGLLVALATTFRLAGLVLVPILFVWLLIFSVGAIRQRLLIAAVSVLTAGAVLGGYVAVYKERTGYTGMARNGAWILYARVAPFADCSKFDPPAGTRQLCEPSQRSARPGPNDYQFGPNTPAFRLYGGALNTSIRPRDNRKLAAFTRAVILHQPLDYLHAVGRDMLRYIVPERFDGPGYGLSFGAMNKTNLLTAPDIHIAPYYPNGYTLYPKYFNTLETYESQTRLEGVLIVVMLLLAAGGPFAARGTLRAGAILFSGVSLVFLVLTPASHFYDSRYAVPAFGPLSGAAALGATAFLTRWQARRKRSAVDPPP